MCSLKISDLSFCEVVAQKDIEVKGGLTIAELIKNTGVLPLVKRLSSDIPDLSNLSLEVKSLPSEDGNIVEKIENKSAGISGLKMTSKDGKTKVSLLTGKNFKFASASNTLSSTTLSS